jgi:K+-transporting ATPase A subunit
MCNKKTFLIAIANLIAPAVLYAQEQAPEMADTMRSNGKIYVVVLVLATIFVGIVAFLIHLERRIKKMEQTRQP